MHSPCSYQMVFLSSTIHLDALDANILHRIKIGNREKVLDHENGSWFHQLNEKNEVIGTVWPGKSDLYHAFQATWIPYGNAAVSIASDVKQKMEK